MVFARSDWQDDATSLVVLGPSTIDQSHAHVDASSFLLFKGGWQAGDAATWSRSGSLWQAGAHNMVTVRGHERRPATVGGITACDEEDGALFVSVDAGGLQTARRSRTDVVLAPEHVRRLVWIEPDTLLVHDVIHTDQPFDWRLHTASMPTREGSRRFSSRHERGALRLQVLIGGEASVLRDDDLEGGGASSYRVQIEPESGARRGRFLVALRVAIGDPPPLAARLVERSSGIDAVVIGDDVVAFPEGARGFEKDAWFDGAGARRLLLAGLERQRRVREEATSIHVGESREQREAADLALRVLRR